MTAVAFAFPGALSTPTGGYGYDRRVIAELQKLGVEVAPLALPSSFPFPSADDLVETGRRLTQSRGKCLVIDGLAFGALPAALVASLESAIIALVHHPLCLETGLAPARAARLMENERAVLAHADAIVTTSAATADILARDFDVAGGKVFVAPPGVDAAPRARGSRDGVVRLVSVGSLLPRKGYEDLLRALAGVEGAWRLTIVGSTDLDPDYAGSVFDLVAAFDLSSRVTIEGALAEADVASRYAAADAFVSASHFEGYGMAIAEAVARGLPVVMTEQVATAGAAPSAAALVYPAGDVAALRAALARIVADADLRARLGAAARAAAHRQVRWSDTAKIMLRAIAHAAERGR
ncbi:MAG: glycosyltransferase family 4 protein [Hyphomicrobiales bacterium]|nr:glycosyltransferase family 4 protein [Hyphomicrobiales bacterium]